MPPLFFNANVTARHVSHFVVADLVEDRLERRLHFI